MSWFQKSHRSIYTKRVHKVTNRVLPYFRVVLYKQKTINKRKVNVKLKKH